MTEISSTTPGPTDRPLPSCIAGTSMQFMPSPIADRALETSPRKPPRRRSREHSGRSPRSSGGPPDFGRGCIGSLPTRSPTCTGVRQPLMRQEPSWPCVPSARKSRLGLATTSIPGSWVGRCTPPSTNCRLATERPSPCAISAGCLPTRPPWRWVARSRPSQSSCIEPLEHFERSWRSTRRLSRGVSNEAISRRHH